MEVAVTVAVVAVAVVMLAVAAAQLAVYLTAALRHCHPVDHCFKLVTGSKYSTRMEKQGSPVRIIMEFPSLYRLH